MTKQEWNGEGLPPDYKVGDICEARFFNSRADEVSREWYTVEILKVREHGEAACLIQGEKLDGRNLYWTNMLRPLQSKEEKEREDAIAEIDRILSVTPSRHEAAARMIDAGYHNSPKVKELSDEEIEVMSEQFNSEDLRFSFVVGAKRTRDYILGNNNG